MDFSKLSSNEKLAVYGSVAVIIGGLVGGLSGLIWLSVLAAFGVLAVLFLPMMSPTTAMPGSKGSLLVVLGGIAGVAALLGLLTIIADIGFWFDRAPVRAIFFVISVAGALLVAWIGWQEFQAEGGKFQMGAATGSATPPASESAPPPVESPARAEPAAPAEPAPAPQPPAAPAAPPPTAEPPADTTTSEEDDRSTV